MSLNPYNIGRCELTDVVHALVGKLKPLWNIKGETIGAFWEEKSVLFRNVYISDYGTFTVGVNGHRIGMHPDYHGIPEATKSHGDNSGPRYERWVGVWDMKAEVPKGHPIPDSHYDWHATRRGFRHAPPTFQTYFLTYPWHNPAARLLPREVVSYEGSDEPHRWTRSPRRYGMAPYLVPDDDCHRNYVADGQKEPIVIRTTDLMAEMRTALERALEELKQSLS